jgi:hypothetical protein
MEVLAYDVRQNPAVEALNIPYHDMDYILERADVISLHVPLLPSTYHLINKDRSDTLTQHGAAAASGSLAASTQAHGADCSITTMIARDTHTVCVGHCPRSAASVFWVAIHQPSGCCQLPTRYLQVLSLCPVGLHVDGCNCVGSRGAVC